jgi:hypothetical protein
MVFENTVLANKVEVLMVEAMTVDAFKVEVRIVLP